MSVHILDPGLLDKLVQVEGKEYRSHIEQWDRMGSVNTPGHAVEQFKAGKVKDWNHPMIYGMGGWNRYAVREDGDVQFSESHASARGSLKKAVAAGFNTY